MKYHKIGFQKIVPPEVEQDLHCHQLEITVTPEPYKSEEIIKPALDLIHILILIIISRMR